MKKDYNSKKKVTIATLSVVAVCLAGGLSYYMNILNNNEPAILPAENTSQIEENIVVPEIEGTSGTVLSEQINHSVDDTIDENNSQSEQSKPSDNKPKSPSEVIPPSEPPTEENTKPVQNENGETEYEYVEPNHSQDTPQGGEKKDGKIYVSGFGWVEDDGGGVDVESTDNGSHNGNKVGDM